MNIKLLSNRIKTILFFGILMFFFNANAQPIITLIGNSTVYVERNKTYTTLGARAFDTLDGDISSNMLYVNDVETSTPGVYTETFSVTNSRGKSASVSRIIIVRNDLTPPKLTLYGKDTIYIEASRNNPNFSEPGAIATDNSYPFVLTSEIRVEGNVNTRRVGTYILKYRVKDIGDNTDSAIRVVIVRDTKEPEWINGRTPHYLPFGEPFIDSVDAIDDYDNSINVTVIIPVGGMVNVNVPGQYDYIYIADSDSSGNKADSLFVRYIVQQKVSVSSFYTESVKIYPTQVNDLVYIKLNNFVETVPTISILGVEGKKLDRIVTMIDNFNYSISISDLPQGIYFIEINYSGKIVTKKIVKY